MPKKGELKVTNIRIGFSSKEMDMTVEPREDGAFNLTIRSKGLQVGADNVESITRRVYPGQLGAMFALAINGRNYKVGLDDLLGDECIDFVRGLPPDLQLF